MVPQFLVYHLDPFLLVVLAYQGFPELLDIQFFQGILAFPKFPLVQLHQFFLEVLLNQLLLEVPEVLGFQSLPKDQLVLEVLCLQ